MFQSIGMCRPKLNYLAVTLYSKTEIEETEFVKSKPVALKLGLLHLPESSTMEQKGEATLS